MKTEDLFSAEAANVMQIAKRVARRRSIAFYLLKVATITGYLTQVYGTVVLWAISTWYLGVVPGLLLTGLSYLVLGYLARGLDSKMSNLYPADPLAEATALAKRIAEAEDKREPMDRAAQLLLAAKTEEDFMSLMEELKTLQAEAEKAEAWATKMETQKDALVASLAQANISDDTFMRFVS